MHTHPALLLQLVACFLLDTLQSRTSTPHPPSFAASCLHASLASSSSEQQPDSNCTQTAADTSRQHQHTIKDSTLCLQLASAQQPDANCTQIPADSTNPMFGPDYVTIYCHSQSKSDFKACPCMQEDCDHAVRTDTGWFGSPPDSSAQPPT